MFVSDLKNGAAVKEVYLVNRKEVKTTRTGKMYIQADLCDSTGSIPCKIWDATPLMAGSFDNGDFLRVTGRVESYQNNLQLNVKSFEKVDPSTVTLGDFLPQTERDVEELYEELIAILATVQDEHLKNLLRAFVSDKEFCAQFKRAPAATQNHHAYLGGLLEHTVSLLKAATSLMELYPMLRRDLLITGIFLHDIGKIREFSYERNFEYTDEGQLLGHLMIGCAMVDEKAREVEGFPAETLTALKHLILSHHGAYEFGSPKLPMTAEAIALHHLDNLDAKIHAFQKAVRESPDEQGSWTGYIRMFERRLFKG